MIWLELYVLILRVTPSDYYASLSRGSQLKRTKQKKMLAYTLMYLSPQNSKRLAQNTSMESIKVNSLASTLAYYFEIL